MRIKVEKSWKRDLGYPENWSSRHYVKDFIILWTFSTLFIKDKDTVLQWLRKNQLLASELAALSLWWNNNFQQMIKDYIFRCKCGQEMGMRKFSFLQRSSYDIRNSILFIKCYLEGHTLHKSTTFSNTVYIDVLVISQTGRMRSADLAGTFGELSPRSWSGRMSRVVFQITPVLYSLWGFG